MHVSDQFVDELFANHHFNTLLSRLNSSKTLSADIESQPQSNNELIAINKVIQDINLTLYNAYKQAISTECNYLYQSNSHILSQIQAMKSKIGALKSYQHQAMPIYSPDKNHLQTSLFFDPENDIKQIRQNINCLQSELDVNHKSLIHSFQMYEDNHDTSKQAKELDFDIEFKINEKVSEQIKVFNDEIKIKAQIFETSVEHRFEQLKKTITKVVQAMNDPSFWANHNNPESQNIENNQISCVQMAKKVPAIKNEGDQTNLLNKSCQGTEIEADSPKKMDTTLPSFPSDRKPEMGSRSNKAMDSLNKSFNFGKTKIKSLFGFKTSAKLQTTLISSQ